MKPIKTLFHTAICGAMILIASKVSASSLPLASLSVSGAILYNTNEVVDTNTARLKVQQTSFVAKDLINLLINSPGVSNTVVDVTTSNGIPTGSYLVLNTDFGSHDLIVTNKSGFSFPLQGFDRLASRSYNYGFIWGTEHAPMVGSFSLDNGVSPVAHTPRPATESDNVLVEFYFDDNNGDSFDVFSQATMVWIADAPAADSQSVTVSISLDGLGSGEVGGFNGIANVSAAGKGSGNELLSDAEFPFFLWWNNQ